MNALPKALGALTLLLCGAAQGAGMATRTGRFPNPITDICWSCILPLSIGNAAGKLALKSKGASASGERKNVA